MLMPICTDIFARKIRCKIILCFIMLFEYLFLHCKINLSSDCKVYLLKFFNLHNFLEFLKPSLTLYLAWQCFSCKSVIYFDKLFIAFVLIYKEVSVSNLNY